MMDAGPAPPAVGVNVNVPNTPAFPATRSTELMTNDKVATAPPIAPDATDEDAVGSALVCTVTEFFPAVGTPMVRPESVTVTAVLAASAVPPVVMMMDVAPGAPDTRVVPFADSVVLGVKLESKKPEG